MCKYLFAAFSLKQREDEGLTPPQIDAVTRWRRTIAHVATEEMLHLVESTRHSCSSASVRCSTSSSSSAREGMALEGATGVDAPVDEFFVRARKRCMKSRPARNSGA
jgi:hypothetical protein